MIAEQNLELIVKRRSAENSIKKSDLAELKNLINPPETVRAVSEALCIVFNVSPTWNEAKKLINNLSLLDKLKTFDYESLTTEQLSKLKKYIDDPEFNAEHVKRSSNCMCQICDWIICIYKLAISNNEVILIFLLI